DGAVGYLGDAHARRFELTQRQGWPLVDRVAEHARGAGQRGGLLGPQVHHRVAVGRDGDPRHQLLLSTSSHWDGSPTTSLMTPRCSRVRRWAMVSATAARRMKPSMRSHWRDQRMRAAMPHAVVTPSRMAVVT